ncbi:amidohydrolase [Eubacteriales bacterium OttesenSCG-928-M02]|nr:amidohydrolase [Eubacteriales bacterium OttesenSCG-928-M02]
MLFEKIAVVDENGDVLAGMYVGTKDGRIDYMDRTPPEMDYEEHYDGAGKLLVPGLVNAHSHLPMTLLRGYGENMTLDRWLNERIFPFEAKMTGEDVYWATLLGLLEMVRFGITSTSDMYYHGEEMARAVMESGMKANLSLSTICFDERAYKELPIYEEARELMKGWQGAGDGRIRIDLCIHGEYTSTPRVVKGLADYAKETGCRVQVHVSETQKEHEECKMRHGKTPVKYFYDLGLFDVPATAAHCVWIEEGDMALLAEKDVTVATCPVSNLKLASGIAPIVPLLKKGVRVALGSDGVASNNDADLYQDRKILSMVQKYRENDPTVLGTKEAFQISTKNGAMAQGRLDTGSIGVGQKADLCVIDFDQPHLQPVHDGLSTLIYAVTGQDVCLTMVDGQVLYRDGLYPTMDMERIIAQVQERKERIVGEIGK